MAEIDKSLPNTKTKLEIPAEEELQEVAVQEEHPETRGSVWKERHKQQKQVKQDLGYNVE